MHTHASPSSAARSRTSVADIFRRHGPAYARLHPLPAGQRKVLNAIRDCRTPALGGQLQMCDTCGEAVPVYHSCRDRHCPTCQAFAQGRWIAARMERVLPVSAFHVVFTLPSELRILARQNAAILYNILFAAAASTLETLARNQLGAELGITAVLHTWNRRMQLHPHLHCVVTAGGLSFDGESFVASDPKFLFPVHVMSDVFRGKFLARLQRAWSSGQLCEDRLQDRRDWRRFRDSLYRRRWVVYAKRPFSGPQHVYAYLGRYTHRVAISSARIKSVSKGIVRFRTRGDETVELTTDHFIGRFLKHVLPRGFRKIRHYGLYAPGRHAAVRRRRAAEHLRSPTAEPDTEPLPWREVAENLLRELRRCPLCNDGLLVPIRDLRPEWNPPPEVTDTS